MPPPYDTPALSDARTATTVSVIANAYDERSSGYGCTTDGCTPDNTRDNSRDANSRWSCHKDLVHGMGRCWIKYMFEDAQDIVRMRVAFHKGDENIRTLNVYVDGQYDGQFESSGSSLGYQNYLLNTQGTTKITLYHDDDGTNTDEWLSLTEVRFSGLRIITLFIVFSNYCCCCDT